jgi:hypothetical protein
MYAYICKKQHFNYLPTFYGLAGFEPSCSEPEVEVWQGCQMVYFCTKISQIGSILKGPAMENVCVFCGHFVYFVISWYPFPCFGTLYQEKSGNPDVRSSDGKPVWDSLKS